jgi:hypothetical protein
MFAEEYASCALGLSQREFQDLGFNSEKYSSALATWGQW